MTSNKTKFRYKGKIITPQFPKNTVSLNSGYINITNPIRLLTPSLTRECLRLTTINIFDSGDECFVDGCTITVKRQLDNTWYGTKLYLCGGIRDPKLRTHFTIPTNSRYHDSFKYIIGNSTPQLWWDRIPSEHTVLALNATSITYHFLPTYVVNSFPNLFQVDHQLINLADEWHTVPVILYDFDLLFSIMLNNAANGLYGTSEIARLTLATFSYSCDPNIISDNNYSPPQCSGYVPYDLNNAICVDAYDSQSFYCPDIYYPISNQLISTERFIVNNYARPWYEKFLDRFEQLFSVKFFEGLLNKFENFLNHIFQIIKDSITGSFQSFFTLIKEEFSKLIQHIKDITFTLDDFLGWLETFIFAIIRFAFDVVLKLLTTRELIDFIINISHDIASALKKLFLFFDDKFIITEILAITFVLKYYRFSFIIVFILILFISIFFGLIRFWPSPTILILNFLESTQPEL